MSDAIEISQVNWSYFLLDGGAMFGIVPRPIWSRLIAPDENNGIRLAARSLVIRTGERVVLVDCGMWGYFSEKLHAKVYAVDPPPLAQTLHVGLGLDVGDVTDIIASHLHFDHVGGLVTRAGEALRPTFPNARFHVQRRQLEWALAGNSKDRASYVPELIEWIAKYDKLAAHDGQWQLVPGVDVGLAEGHTPAMQITRVQWGERLVIHAGDMVPTSAHVSIPYIMAYDTQPMETAADKERYFTGYPEALYFFEHDPDHPLWSISCDEKGRWGRGEAEQWKIESRK